MGYLCSTHHFPVRTFGEMGTKEEELAIFEEREAERSRLLQENGQPTLGGALTIEVIEWVRDTELGRRCWYCGKINPAARHAIHAERN